jgi:hypothetical protein
MVEELICMGMNASPALASAPSVAHKPRLAESAIRLRIVFLPWLMEI